MKPIEVFYHLFIPNDLRYSAWTWYVNQQLQCIKNSHLHSVANINMAITMPRNWKLSFDNIPFFSNDKTKELTFEEKIREYIQVRFPFVNILDVRDIADTNLFEGHTLGLLYEKCIDLDVNILYFHGKGIVRDSPQVSAWREILNYYCISSWKTCVKMLEHADVVGVKDAKTGNYITSGNFWWTRSKHIKNLSHPLNVHEYMSDSQFHVHAPAYRYAFERWILSNNPKVEYIIDTKTDHYDCYCFLENLL